MQVLNFGSLNIDYVYQQTHIVRPGETLGSRSMQVHPGGKGANQSAALGLAGVAVKHAGRIAKDGEWLLAHLQKSGVDTTFIDTDAEHTGHAIIQVDDHGENAIILFGGGNQSIEEEHVEKVIQSYQPNDILLLQNEINNIPLIMRKAAEQGMKIYFNPAPYEDAIRDFPLDLVSCFILNETEGAGLSEALEMEEVLENLHKQYPQADIVLTLGGDGVLFKSADERIQVPANKVEVVDTTAAGDTFIGYFIASRINGMNAEQSLKRACAAAGIAVGRAGALESVPNPEEVDALL